MAWNSKPSHKHLLLHIWCGLLTVAMLVIIALLVSIKSKSAAPDEVRPPEPSASPTVNTIAAPLRGSSPSHIQLMKSPDNLSWQDSQSCDPCDLVHQRGSVLCLKDSLIFLYAQVAFAADRSPRHKSVVLIRNPANGTSLRILAEGTFPPATEGSVWVANVVRLRKDDRVSINITGEFLSDLTHWGAYELP